MAYRIVIYARPSTAAVKGETGTVHFLCLCVCECALRSGWYLQHVQIWWAHTRREHREYCNLAVEIPPHDLVRNVGGRVRWHVHDSYFLIVRWVMRVIGVGAMQVCVWVGLCLSISLSYLLITVVWKRCKKWAVNGVGGKPTSRALDRICMSNYTL